MNKFLISIATVVTVGALILVGCPDDSGSGTAVACVAPTDGATTTVGLIYGDAPYTGCSQFELAAATPFGQFGTATFTETSGGANNTSSAYTLALTDDAAVFGGGFISLGADYNAAGKSLNFSVKSDATADGGYNMIRVYLEADPGAGGTAFPDYQTLGTEGIQTFTNDGTWQDVSVNLAVEFSNSFAAAGTGAASQITAANIRSVGFALLDSNGTDPGIGAQVISVDEVRFEDVGLSYICKNGTPTTGDGATAGVSNCQMCNAGFTEFGTLGQEGSMCAYQYICENGTANPGPAGRENTSNCDSCDATYQSLGTLGEVGSECITFAYICENGTPTTGDGNSIGVSNCRMCDNGYTVSGNFGAEGSTCVSLAYTCENGVVADGFGTAVGQSNCETCSEGYVISGNAGEVGSTCVNFSFVCENGAPSLGTTTIEGQLSCRGCDPGYQISGTIDEVGSTCTTTGFPYICANGTPAAGATTSADVSNCRRCDPGYTISGMADFVGSTCVNFSYVCANGMASPGTTIIEGQSNCASCDQGFTIIGTANTPGSACGNLSYVCENGVATSGIAPAADQSRCDSCNAGYSIFGAAGVLGSTCVTLPSACTATGSTDSSIFTVYSEGTYAACNPVQLTASRIGSHSQPPGAVVPSFAEMNGGTNGTSKALSLSAAAGATTFANGYITFNNNFDVSGKTLRFNVKSPATGGTNTIQVTLGAERSINDSSARTEGGVGVVNFANDGTWQEVAINIDRTYSFSQSNITAATVRRIHFYLEEAGAQTFDIDEVRFEEPTPNCNAPMTGNAVVDLIWGDVVYNSCDAISSGFYGAVHVPRYNAANRPRSPFAFASNAVSSLGGGASSSPLFTSLTLGTGNSRYAYGIADFPANYNATGKTLKFSIKSPAAASGGVGSIDIFLEGSPLARTDTVNQTFTNDGSWQDISVPITSFTFPASGVSLTTVRRLVFSLVDSNGLSADGVGAQTLDIDEIRFE